MPTSPFPGENKQNSFSQIILNDEDLFQVALTLPRHQLSGRNKEESEDVSMWPFLLQLQEREAGSRNEIISVYFYSTFFGGELIKNCAGLQRMLITGS